ncbi:MAG: hypothetical protein JXM69_17995 [Anaerolineae bacterium]|nr:hypothetical protein [Anaerolineae bacterium]
MFTTDADTPSKDSAGLLTQPGQVIRPRAWLGRLRPVTLTGFQYRLGEYERLGRGLRLIEQYFPAALADDGDLSGKGWWEVLAHLANLVEEADWFTINWPVLNDAWSHWMENPDEERGDHLAVFLHYVPVTLYGFTDTESLFDCPPMELLHALLAECEIHAVSSQLLIDSELYDHLDEWTPQERESAWRLLQQIEADPGRYAEPVRWLPELARWAGHRTGNVMLDQHFDPYREGPWFTWREPDVEQLKTAWRRAKPVIEVLDRLLAWYEQDHGRLAQLADFLMNGGNCHDLAW